MTVFYSSYETVNQENTLHSFIYRLQFSLWLQVHYEWLPVYGSIGMMDALITEYISFAFVSIPNLTEVYSEIYFFLPE